MKYFIIYKTTNLINNKIYIGAHSTADLNDDYIGSGLLLGRAIGKYGISNFKKEIIHFCSSGDEMYTMEKEIVNEEFVKRTDTYNIKTGGLGGQPDISRASMCGQGNPNFGGKYCNGQKARDSIRGKTWEEIYGEARAKNRKKIIHKKMKEKWLTPEYRKNREFSDETKNKISLARTGKRLTDEQKRQLREKRNFKGGKNPRAKNWKIVDKEGNCFFSETLGEFAMRVGLTISAVKYRYSCTSIPKLK